MNKKERSAVQVPRNEADIDTTENAAGGRHAKSSRSDAARKAAENITESPASLNRINLGGGDFYKIKDYDELRTSILESISKLGKKQTYTAAEFDRGYWTFMDDEMRRVYEKCIVHMIAHKRLPLAVVKRDHVGKANNWLTFELRPEIISSDALILMWEIWDRKLWTIFNRRDRTAFADCILELLQQGHLQASLTRKRSK